MPTHTGVHVDLELGRRSFLESPDDAAAIEAVLGVAFEDLEHFVDGLPRHVFPFRRRRDGERKTTQRVFQGHGRHLGEG